ncbi:Rid family hydrolase [Catalinimonas alkaloidigena]|nr:Rid family hydrolase [Catalinimonas alkaloidigena]
MMRTFSLSLISLFLLGLLSRCATPGSAAPDTAPDSVTFYGAQTTPFSAGAIVPAGHTLHITAGTVAPLLDSAAAPGSSARYGDTYTQAVGALRRIDANLQQHGLSLADVVQLRAFLGPDSTGAPDFQAWFKAYGEFFNNETNPTRPARSTLGVSHLVNPDMLIELEAVAVQKKE